jgi:hypothetical protein
LAELLEKRERDSCCCHTHIFANFRFVSRPVVKLAVWTLNFSSWMEAKYTPCLGIQSRQSGRLLQAVGGKSEQMLEVLANEDIRPSPYSA